MSKLDALRRMANQDVSPHERDIARAKLEAAGHGWDEPPRRPPAAGANPMPMWFDGSWTSNATTAATTTWNFATVATADGNVW